MSGMADWLLDDEISRTIVYLQSLRCLGRCGAIGCRQGGRGAADNADCSLTVKSEDLPADRTPLSISSAGAAMVADKGAQLLTQRRFISC